MNILKNINKNHNKKDIKVEVKNKIKLKENNTKKVLILSCGMGGGHNSAALAIQESLLERGIVADFREYLDITNPKLKDRVNHIYIKSTHGDGKVFKTVYHLGKLYQKTNLKSPVYELNRLNGNKLYKYIMDNNYDYVVTSHLFPAHTLTAIKKSNDIHFIEIATDYESIPFWEETNPDFFVIPSVELEKTFLDKGFKKDILLPLGIPVSKKYSEKYDVDECRKKLGLDINKKYILILTGSMGFGNVTEMLGKLLKKIKNATFIVACGTNDRLFDKLSKEYKNVIALQFTNNISMYMKSSDIILSKPGGLTTTEIATLRKPFIHTMPIPGCENCNADFFAKRKMSMKSDNIDEVVENTYRLLNDKKLQLEIIKNQEKYININACDNIVDKILYEMENNIKNL